MQAPLPMGSPSRLWAKALCAATKATAPKIKEEKMQVFSAKAATQAFALKVPENSKRNGDECLQQTTLVRDFYQDP